VGQSGMLAGMDEKETDYDVIIHMLMEIERRQKLTAIMIAVFGLIWAFSKLFPIVIAGFGG